MPGLYQKIFKTGIVTEPLGPDAAEIVQLDASRLVGMIRLADLLTAPIAMHYRPHLSERRDEKQLLETWEKLPVSNIMNVQMISVSEDTPLMKAAALLINNGRQRLPVLRAGKVVGMISRADIVRTLLMSKNA